jgi:hypothetical protein
MVFNPALNLAAFAAPSANAAPPSVNAFYLHDGKYDGMTRADVCRDLRGISRANGNGPTCIVLSRRVGG